LISRKSKEGAKSNSDSKSEKDKGRVSSFSGWERTF